MDRNLARNLVCVVLVALYHIRNGQQKEDARKQAKAADEEGGKPCE